MLNSDLSPAAPQGGRLPPTDKTRVVSTRRRVPTNWVSGRTLQPSIESVVANSFVPSDFLVDGQVSGLGTVHPLLTLSFVSTWIPPLHVVSSTLKRKSSSSVMDGLQRKRKNIYYHLICHNIDYFHVSIVDMIRVGNNTESQLDELLSRKERKWIWDLCSITHYGLNQDDTVKTNGVENVKSVIGLYDYLFSYF